MNTFNTKTVEIKDNYFGSYRIGFPDSSAMLCATFHDGFEPEINKQHAERIVNSWNEYDKLKEDNEKLQAYSKDLIESNIDLSNVRNRLHEEKMKLREDNALLIEALRDIADSTLKPLCVFSNGWDKEAVTSQYNKAKELLNNIKKNKQ